MGSAPSNPKHQACGYAALRIYDCNFAEDRYRFFKNPVDGTSFSYSLGIEHPDNRRDYYAALEQRGCEPVTRATMPERWKRDQEYLDHVRTGGERIDAEEHPPPGPAVGVRVLDQMRKTGFRVG
jgi:hypothetical protein